MVNGRIFIGKQYNICTLFPMPTHKKGICFKDDVFFELEHYSKKRYKGNFSAAQDAINREFFRFSLNQTKDKTVQTHLPT